MLISKCRFCHILWRFFFCSHPRIGGGARSKSVAVTDGRCCNRFETVFFCFGGMVGDAGPRCTRVPAPATRTPVEPEQVEPVKSGLRKPTLGENLCGAPLRATIEA